jgi:hypothetical protein
MTTGRKVEAAPLFARPLDLFASGHDAWSHLVKHVLNNRGEFGSWGILIPDLQAALDAGRREELYDRARSGSPDRVPAELRTVWPAFLDLVAAAVEQAVRREWYWEERSGPEPGTVRAFAASGILAYLDGTVVRTGFLPFQEGLPPGCVTDLDRRYQLFYECWRKVRFKYQRAQQDGRGVRESAAMRDLMQKVLNRLAWEKRS